MPSPKPGTLVSWIGSMKSSYIDASLCLTTANSGPVTTAHCARGATTQQWRLTGGLVRTATGHACLHTTSTTVTAGSCGSGPARWSVTAIGQLRTDDRCLTQDDLLRAHPKLHLAACTSIDPGQYWFAGRGVVNGRPARDVLADTGTPLVPLTVVAGMLLATGLSLRLTTRTRSDR